MLTDSGGAAEQAKLCKHCAARHAGAWPGGGGELTTTTAADIAFDKAKNNQHVLKDSCHDPAQRSMLPGCLRSESFSGGRDARCTAAITH